MRFNLQANLYGYAGANVAAAAEFGFNVDKGKMYIEGLKPGESQNYPEGKKKPIADRPTHELNYRVNDTEKYPKDSPRPGGEKHERPSCLRSLRV